MSRSSTSITPLEFSSPAPGELSMILPADFDYADELALARVAACIVQVSGSATGAA